MRVPGVGLVPIKHELQLMLEGQGPQVCKEILESPDIGARFRHHAERCAACGDIKRELYGDKPIPVRPEPLT
jgi:hypothetical protein